MEPPNTTHPQRIWTTEGEQHTPAGKARRAHGADTTILMQPSPRSLGVMQRPASTPPHPRMDHKVALGAPLPSTEEGRAAGQCFHHPIATTIQPGLPRSLGRRASDLFPLGCMKTLVELGALATKWPRPKKDDAASNQLLWRKKRQPHFVLSRPLLPSHLQLPTPLKLSNSAPSTRSAHTVWTGRLREAAGPWEGHLYACHTIPPAPSPSSYVSPLLPQAVLV